jgi:calcineurin-like phosphoesterase
VANPYLAIQALIEKLKPEVQAICLQFHASTTAEKQTMAHHVNGKISAMVGTHTKVLTSDARVLSGGTAMVTDNGHCGSTAGVGGFDAKIEIERFLTQIPSRSIESWENLELQGVLVEIDEAGKATGIETIRQSVATPEQKPA